MAEIQNPNQQGGGGQDSRTMMTVMVIFLVMFVGLQYFKQKKPQPQQPQHAQTAQQQVPQTETPAAAGAVPGAAQPVAGQANAVQANAVQATAASQTVVENELYRITFSNRGGEVTSWVLKKYTDEAGRPLDLINRDADGKYGLPLGLYSYDAGLRTKLNQALYVPSATGTLTAPATLSFDYSAGGLTVHKSFHFDNSYVLHADVSATLNGAPIAAMLEWPAGFGDQVTLPQYAGSAFDDAHDGKTDELATKKVVGGATLNGPFDYAGVSDLYFAAIFLPDAPADTTVVSLHNTVVLPKDRKHPDPEQTEKASVLGAAIGNPGGTLHTRVFVGPKSLDVLGSIKAVNGQNLEKVVDFGFWGWVAKPMFLVLRFFYDHGIRNWGWSILLLTVILNVAMLPTRIQMMKSSLKMQRIQPEMEQVKARYAKYKATDPRRQEMNREIMDLQKREGVNMFGGCLPMLLQYPLLYGFYRMLEYVIELRHAHWLWLPDLSAPDPWHILPIFVIVSMFLVQFFTPSPGMDQQQQRMMAFMMPAMFGFMMWNIGSGVALYWAGGNIISVGQQMVMNNTGLGKEMRALQAKRAAKKRAGKVINARR